MAKATKKKSEEQVPEITPEVKSEEVVAPETKEQPVIEEIREKQPEKIAEEVKPEPPKIVYRKELDKDLPMEERIIAYLESRGASTFIKVNDFLKSLYPVQGFNEPPKWKDQGTMKRLRVMLDKMKSHGQLRIENNGHAFLGAHYYADTPDGQRFARFHDLDDTIILMSM